MSDVPTHVPEGMTHIAFVLGEAETSFRSGDQKSGVINLAHAVYALASEREELSEAAARQWFARITKAAGAWE